MSDPTRSTTDKTTKRTLPRYITNTVVTEHVCTLQSCSHCCKCHLRHNKNGYGRCMKSASAPWPDCECAGKCTAGRCAQPECASNRVVVDLTASPPVSGSQSTLTSPAAHSQQQRQQQDDNDRHQPGVSAVSHTSTPSSPLPGARREAGGVHHGEEVCVGPQADTHASSSAAYRQPSATVTDSWSAASQAVGKVDGSEATAHTTGTSCGDARSDVPVDRPLPRAVLDELLSLSRQPRRLPVIADGRCSVASVLLARGMIDDAHINERGRQTIDAERRRLGRSMMDRWTEADWIRRVPMHIRGAYTTYDQTDPAGTRRHSSHKALHHLLTEKAPTEWLDHAVFYLASAEYGIGVFIIRTADSGKWYCERIGEEADRHIVLYQACGHYECVEYDGLRLFPSDHEFVGRMSEFAARHPGHPDIEDDIELQALVAQEAAGAEMTGAAGAARADVDSQSTPLRMVTPRAAARLSTAQKSSKQATPRSKRSSKSKAKRALNLSEAETTTANIPLSDGVKPLPPLIAQVAEHGPLYERVSFHNQPQWRAANEPLWNAYRLASMTGQRSQLTPILLDLLQLPQRVLPKLGRSGRAASRRGGGRRKHVGCAVRLSDCVSATTARTRSTKDAAADADVDRHDGQHYGVDQAWRDRDERPPSPPWRQSVSRQLTLQTPRPALSRIEEAGGAYYCRDSDDDERDDPFPSLSRRSQAPRDRP